MGFLNSASPCGDSGRVRIDTAIVTNNELLKSSVREEAALRCISATPATNRKIECFKNSEQAVASAADYIILDLAALNALVSVVACKTCRGCVKIVRGDRDYGLATKTTIGVRTLW